MRYEKGHGDATRERIVEAASGQFRKNGVAAVGIAGIMSGAGLTNGAFYTHFESKEDLVRTVLLNALGRREQALRAVAESGAGLEASLRDYLSPRHRDNPGQGCPTAALVAEVARHPKKTRDAFTSRVSGIIGQIEARLPAGPAGESHCKAIAIYGLMVGTLQLARAVNDQKLSDEILESGVLAALALAGAS